MGENGSGCVQPYIRVSTTDRGQEPDRQWDLVRAWAGIHGLQCTEPVVDEGTSGTFVADPFQRPRFQEAIRQARAQGCRAIAVDVIDRLTRGGIESWAVAKFVLRGEHHLELWHAEAPPSAQSTAIGEFFSAAKAWLARLEAENQIRRVTSGMALAKQKGIHVGRPAKPIPVAEVLRVIELRQEGLGWDRVAVEINRARRVHELASYEARRRRMTSGPSLRRAVLAHQALQNQNPTKLRHERKEARPR